jgi:hypothetical protein
VTCNPERLSAYVDCALPEASRTEIDAHLSTCFACQEQVAFERELKERLRALPPVAPRPHFEAGIREGIRTAPSPARLLLPVAAGLAAVLVWAMGTPRFVAWELAKDHTHCFSFEQLPAQVWGNPGAVMAWFEGHGEPLPLLPESVSGLELVGGRRCDLLDGSHAAHLYYVGRERRLSVFVLQKGIRLGDSYATIFQDHWVRLIRVEGHVVGLVGESEVDVEAFRRALTATMAGALASSAFHG